MPKHRKRDVSIVQFIINNVCQNGRLTPREAAEIRKAIDVLEDSTPPKPEDDVIHRCETGCEIIQADYGIWCCTNCWGVVLDDPYYDDDDEPPYFPVCPYCGARPMYSSSVDKQYLLYRSDFSEC